MLVLGIGNAIVDVLTHTDDAFLARYGLAKGSMTLIDASRAVELYGLMESTIECSGGSAANTMAGLASMGGKGAYVGKVRNDVLGEVFAKDIRATGVAYATEPSTSGPTTARCMIFVTPDAQRTMQTYLGASATLAPEDIDPEEVGKAGITFLEGYLWDPEPAKKAFLKAAEIAHQAGGRVALTLSDPFCVDRHREEFRDLVQNHVDILFANEDEIVSLYRTDDLDAAVGHLRGQCEIAAITRGADGSIILSGEETLSVAAQPVDNVVDTTGAGDLFAAGFLFGLSEGLDLADCGKLGGIAAAEIISHFGARPETSLRDLVP